MKNKNLNPEKFVSDTDNSGQRNILGSAHEERIKQIWMDHIEEEFYERNPVMVFTLTTEGEGKNKKVKVVSKRLTAKQVADIEAETKKKFKKMMAVPPPPVTVITPAPGFGNKNSAEVCTYVADRLPRVVAVSAFDTCSPTPLQCQEIYDALLPLTGIGRKISTSDKETRDDLTKQLKNTFTGMAYSCALLSNGNAPLFALTEIATRKSPVRNHTRLAAPVVTLNTKKGMGTLGVKCRKIRYAINYSIAYGTTDDQSTWTVQTGSSNQKIVDQTPGVKLNIIMWANSATGKGFPSPVQSINVPFN